MKLYDFECRQCDHRFEELVRGPDDGKDLTCPACGARGADAVLTGFAVAGRAGLSASAASAASACSPRGGFS